MNWPRMTALLTWTFSLQCINTIWQLSQPGILQYTVPRWQLFCIPSSNTEYHSGQYIHPGWQPPPNTTSNGGFLKQYYSIAPERKPLIIPHLTNLIRGRIAKSAWAEKAHLSARVDLKVLSLYLGTAVVVFVGFLFLIDSIEADRRLLLALLLSGLLVFCCPFLFSFSNPFHQK